MFNLNIIDIILFISAILTFLLASTIFFKDPKNKVNLFYGLSVFFASAWTFGIAIFRIINFTYGYFWIIFYYTSAALIAIYYLYFVINFLNHNNKRYNLFQHILIYLPLIITLFIIFFNLRFINKYEIVGVKKIVKLGQGYLFYMIYFVSYMTSAFIILGKRISKASYIEKIQLKFVLYGSMGTTIPASVFNLFLPIFTYKYIWLGPYFTLVMVTALAYAILKHNLLNIKLIAIEIFTALILIILLAEIFLVKSVTEMIIKIVIFFMVSFLVYLIIRSVLKEVEAREKIEKLAKEIEQANAQLEEKNIQLAKQDKYKSEFVSIASHQLRSPLTAIKGYSSMMLEGNFGEIKGKMKEVADRIFQSSNRLVSLIGDFLDVSRIELGKMQYEFTDFDIGEMIQNLVEEFRINNKNPGIEIYFESKDIGKINIHADYNKIRQVVSNLIDNAMKYTQKGFIRIFLAKDKPLNITIAVKDSGQGINKDDFDKIFHKFSRSDEASKSHVNGTGLGLYVVSEMIKAHNGRVWAESEGLGKGSTFYVELPLNFVPPANSKNGKEII